MYLLAWLMSLQRNMFQLEFFKVVKQTCCNERFTGVYMNEHQSVVSKSKPVAAPEYNRELVEYIQWTYMPYFGIKMPDPRHVMKNRHCLANQSRDLFWPR